MAEMRRTSFTAQHRLWLHNLIKSPFSPFSFSAHYGNRPVEILPLVRAVPMSLHAREGFEAEIMSKKGRAPLLP